ncbi:MAG: aminoglycoside phosphotransferase family protein [Armatimonadetes bacterium]|nr:aminoglycoside phosphotransferase family protein [Armatimonadota bacterium]
MTPGQFRTFEVTLEMAVALCREHGLAEPLSVSRLAKGEVSAVFGMELADGQGAVLKAYLRNQEPRVLVAEDEVLGHLRRHSALPVPAWSMLNLNGGKLGWPYALHQRLPGIDADTLLERLDMAESARLLRRCGEMLSRLHRVSLSGSGLKRAGVAAAAAWASNQDAEFDLAMERLGQQGWLDARLLDRARQVWSVGREIRQLPFDPVLCHGDYQLWNILIDPETLVPTGLLDLGQAYLGPASADFRDMELNLWGNSPRLRSAFLQGYGWDDIDERERERLRQAALCRALVLMSAYWGPTKQITPATVWHLLAPWSEDAEA